MNKDKKTNGRPMKSLSPSQMERRAAPYYRELGKFLALWNNMHDNLALLFWAVTGIENGAVPLAIWHSTPSDLAQRKMLRAATDVALSGKPREDVLWLLDQIDQRLSWRRNDAVHAPFTFVSYHQHGTKFEPSTFYGNPRAKSLEGKNILDELRWYREHTIAVLNFIHALHFQLISPSTAPWPERPQLPHLIHTKNHKAAARRRIAK